MKKIYVRMATQVVMVSILGAGVIKLFTHGMGV